MHKRISSLGQDESSNSMKDKNSYGFLKIVCLNLVSTAGLIQVIMLLCIVFKIMDIFTLVYFIINLLICIGSLKKLLEEPKKEGKCR